MTTAQHLNTDSGVTPMTTALVGCDHCNADVTFRPDPDHHLIMHVDVAHDDDCKFYLRLEAERGARK